MSLSMPSLQVPVTLISEPQSRRRQPGLCHFQSSGSREQDLEGGALAGLTLHANGTLMLQDDAPRDGQAQAGALGFGGEKRLEQARHILRRNTDACVFDHNPQVWLGHQIPW